MTTALIYTAFLATLAIIIWLSARKAARAEQELEYVKKDNKRQKEATKILGRYVNLSSYELSQRVLEKRKATAKRMSSKDRLD